MALGFLMIFFVVTLVISIITTSLMFILKNETASSIFFILASAIAVLVTVLHATALPSNYTGHILFAWLMGVPAIVGLVLRFVVKKNYFLAKILVTVSVFMGIFGAFL